MRFIGINALRERISTKVLNRVEDTKSRCKQEPFRQVAFRKSRKDVNKLSIKGFHGSKKKYRERRANTNSQLIQVGLQI